MEKKSILVLEGDDTLRKQILKELLDYGYDALATFRYRSEVAEKFDVVCLDSGIEYEEGIANLCEDIKSKGTGLLLMTDDPYLGGELLEMELVDGYANKDLDNIKEALKIYFDHVHSISR